jgi:hypothetical protein
MGESIMMPMHVAGLLVSQLPVVYPGSIIRCAGDLISFGIMGFFEIGRSLP